MLHGISVRPMMLRYCSQKMQRDLARKNPSMQSLLVSCLVKGTQEPIGFDGHGDGLMCAGAPTKPASTPNLMSKRKNSLLATLCNGFESV